MTANRTRGQKAGLTRGAVLEGAVRLVDRDGLAKLSMRRLGAEVGVEAMTLYNYFANKEALLDGLVEHVFSLATLSLEEDASWQAWLRGYAHSLRATLLAHPSLMPVVITRPAVTPQSLRVMEYGLRELRKAGFPTRAAMDLVYSLTEFVVGHVATSPTASAPDGSPAKEEHLSGVDPEEFPLIVEAIAAPRPEGEDARFDVALEAMFRGFAGFIR